MIINGICKICDKPFSKDIKRCRLQTSAGETCSRECSYKLMGQNRETLIVFKCIVCKKEVKRCEAHYERSKGRYCSHECHSKDREKNDRKKKELCHGMNINLISIKLGDCKIITLDNRFTKALKYIK